MRKYIFGATVMLSLFAVACKKDKDMLKATVLDAGDIAKGGCGYILRLDNGDELRPSYLPSAYQHNGYKVKVKYHGDGQGVVCSIMSDSAKRFIEAVDIDDIKRDID